MRQLEEGLPDILSHFSIMWWFLLLAGNWISWGETLIFGKGGAGGMCSEKGQQLGEKRL